MLTLFLGIVSFCNSQLKLISSMSAIALLLVGHASAQQAVQSDALVESVGVNIHLHNGGTLYYTNYPFVKQALLNLGVRHVREGLIDTPWQGFYDRLNDLGTVGVKGLFVSNPAESGYLLETWPSRVSSSFEAYESPNEYDTQANWASALEGFEPVLYSAAKAGAAPGAPVVGPSLTQSASYAELGDISSSLDVGNLHNYYAGRNPGNIGWGGTDSAGHRFGSIPYSLDYLKIVAAAKPTWVTETGYTNQTSYANYVTQQIAAVYMPRLILEHWNAGIKRTYLYELISSGGEDFGLMNADGSAKPAYNAISNLLTLLADRGETFVPESLAYTLTGQTSNMHQLLLQKRNGDFYLALWLEAESYDPDNHVNIAVPPKLVTLQSPSPLSGITSYQWDDNGNMAASTHPDSATVSLVVSDRLQIVRLSRSGTLKVTSAVNPLNAGVVSLTPVTSDSYAQAGSVVTATASANAGYQFTGFTGQIASPSSTTSFVVTQNTNVVANFSCSYSVDTSHLDELTSKVFIVPSTASFLTLPYSTGAGCKNTPTTSAPWLTASAAGGVLTVSASPNLSFSRTAIVTLGNTQIAFTQNATGTTYAVMAGNVPGATICVDGKPYLVGWKLKWNIGDSHLISGCGVENIGNILYLFQGWSAGLAGTSDQIIRAAASTVTYGSILTKAGSLSLYMIGKGSTSATPARAVYQGKLLYYPTDKVSISAAAGTNCSFLGWAGTVNQQAALVNLSVGPGTIMTARFTCK